MKKCLGGLTKTSVAMQFQGCTLSCCVANLKVLIHDVETHSSDANHDLHDFTLSDMCIGEGSDELSDPLFESGIVKLQNSDEGSMTDEEHESCNRLLLKFNEEESLINSSQPSAHQMFYEDRLELLQKT